MNKLFYKVHRYDAKNGRYILRPFARFSREDLIACALGLGVSALIVVGLSVDFLVGG